MTEDERKVYRLERRLIRQHFKGLAPRPIKLVSGVDFEGRAEGPHLLVNKRLLNRPRELKNTLKHELIHYELKDAGKDYHRHGEAFLKRAAALGVVGVYDLQRCFSTKECRVTGTRREIVRIPTRMFKEKRFDVSLANLHKAVLALPSDKKMRLYPLVQELEANATALWGAIEHGKKYVYEEIVRRRPRRDAKTLQEWDKIYRKAVAAERRAWQRFSGDPDNPQFLEAVSRAEDRIAEIAKKIKKEFDVVP